MTKEELSKLKKIKQEIEQIKKELDDAKYDCDFVADSVKGSSRYFPYNERIIGIQGIGYCEQKAERIQRRLNRKLEELMDKKDEINEFIYTLEDSDIRQILTYRYINGLKWEQIGYNMNYAARTVRLKHDMLIKTLM